MASEIYCLSCWDKGDHEFIETLARGVGSVRPVIEHPTEINWDYQNTMIDFNLANISNETFDSPHYNILFSHFSN